ncbi:hypothetical protein D3C75_835470 [compost metagenome]
MIRVLLGDLNPGTMYGEFPVKLLKPLQIRSRWRFSQHRNAPLCQAVQIIQAGRTADRDDHEIWGILFQQAFKRAV